MHVSPASMNETITAGPDLPIPWPMTTKMPVPMTAPTPRAVRSSAPTAFLSEPSPDSVSLTSCWWSLTAHGPVDLSPATAIPHLHESHSPLEEPHYPECVGTRGQNLLSWDPPSSRVAIRCQTVVSLGTRGRRGWKHR